MSILTVFSGFHFFKKTKYKWLNGTFSIRNSMFFVSSLNRREESYFTFILVAMLDSELNNILWDQNHKDPFFDLQTIEIPKNNFDPKTPVNIINNDLENFRDYLVVGHLNARSLNKNITELKAIMDKTDFDAVSISESWLRSRTPKDRFMIDGYKIFRNDRKNKRGGGVCLYVREEYECKRIKIPNTPESPEVLWVEVTVNHKKIAIGTLYKAPNIPCKTFYDAYDSLVYIFSKYEDPILTGDFNVNMLNTESSDLKKLNDSIIEPFDLKQIINKPTRITDKSATLIDLMFVKDVDKVKTFGQCDASGVSDHFFIYMAYNIKKPKFKPITVTRRDFRKFDLPGFQRAAEVANWENVFAVHDVDDKVTILENTINDLLDKFAPYKTFTLKKPNSTPWLTDEIRQVMDKRDMFKHNFNLTGNKNFKKNYKELRNKVTSMMRQSQKNMFNDTINSKVKDPKDFYKTAKKLNIISDKTNKAKVNFPAETLNQTFLQNNNAPIDSNFIKEKLNNLYKNFPPSIHKFAFQAVSEQDLIKVTKNLKSMSVGVDKINSFVIKALLPRISTVLVHIVNISFELGIFPENWKKAVITPIPKVSIPLSPNDFRPISLLPTLSKIIEKLANIQIVAYLVKHNFLDPYQSAYIKKHSTQTALLKLTEDIYDTIDDSELTLLVLLDFSKAFDTVNHKLLLAKLDILGFQKNTCDWILSYLSGRKQMVRTERESSNWSPIINGVPQGSILGPLLFTILVSDMRRSIWNGSYISYADDTNLYWESPVEAINETIDTANKVLEKVSTYCTDNCLRLNESKCKFIFIGSKPAIRKLNNLDLNHLKINGSNMERLTYAKILGVTFDEVLSWQKQVNLCISKAMGNFFQIYRYKKFLDKDSKIILCESIVLSQFNYCDTVYSNMDTFLEQKIQKIQNLCLRFIFGYGKRESCDYNALLTSLKWLNMKNRRIKHGLTMIYKILNGLAPNYLSDAFTLTNQIHNVNTRRVNNSIWINKSITSKIHRKAYTFYMSKIYNNLPENIKQSVSVNSFKHAIKSYIQSGMMVLPSI